MSDGSYVLGYSDAEHRRLRAQARLLQPWTEHFLRSGGLREGMTVLDVGSGAGDVSFAAADIVGASGRVIGVDRHAGSVERATSRSAEAGYSGRVSFTAAELDTYEADAELDAIVGRYVLLYLPDPARTLRRLARSLRPGGPCPPGCPSTTRWATNSGPPSVSGPARSWDPPSTAPGSASRADRRHRGAPAGRHQSVT